MIQRSFLRNPQEYILFSEIKEALQIRVINASNDFARNNRPRNEWKEGREATESDGVRKRGGRRQNRRCAGARERKGEKIYRHIMHALLNASYYNISTRWATHSTYYYDKCSCGSHEWRVAGVLRHILKTYLETGRFSNVIAYEQLVYRRFADMSLNFNFASRITRRATFYRIKRFMRRIRGAASDICRPIQMRRRRLTFLRSSLQSLSTNARCKGMRSFLSADCPLTTVQNRGSVSCECIARCNAEKTKWKKIGASQAWQ